MAATPQSLADLSSLLAAHGATLAEATGASRVPADPLELVRISRDADDIAARLLKLCVSQARDAGHTWQEVGDLLGVTRQAAFQRFGKPIDPRTGEPMDKTVHMAGAAARAREVTAAILDGRMDEARGSFDPQVREALTDEVRGDELAAVAGLVGAYEGPGEGEPFVRRIGDHTVVDIPLRYEAGEMKARVAFGTDEMVAGFHVLTPDTP